MTKTPCDIATQCTSIKDFIAACNELYESWRKFHDNPNDISFTRNLQSNYGFDFKKFDINGLPEPYYGDPASACSAVIVNINPGETKEFNTIARIKKHSFYQNNEEYYNFAKKFLYVLYDKITDEQRYNAHVGDCLDADHDWFVSQNTWVENLLSSGKKSLKKPINLELCPWHSKKWPGWEEHIVDYFNNWLLMPISEAISNSDLKDFALMVSSTKLYPEVVIQKCRFQEIALWRVFPESKKIKEYESIPTSDPINYDDMAAEVRKRLIDKELGGKKTGMKGRYYSLIKKEIGDKKIYILCTYANGSNVTPAANLSSDKRYTVVGGNEQKYIPEHYIIKRAKK